MLAALILWLSLLLMAALSGSVPLRKRSLDSVMESGESGDDSHLLMMEMLSLRWWEFLLILVSLGPGSRDLLFRFQVLSRGMGVGRTAMQARLCRFLPVP